MGFRENLREAIDYCGIEQKELAHKSQVGLRSIENYLREDGSMPSADKAVQIANVLGVTVEYLVTGTDSTKKTSASIGTETDPKIDHETRKLIRAIKSLPDNKQRIVIKNALNLIGIIKEL